MVNSLETKLEAIGAGLKIRMRCYEPIEKFKFVAPSGHADAYGPSISKADCTDLEHYPAFGFSLNAGNAGQYITVLLVGFVLCDTQVPIGPVYLDTDGGFTDALAGSCACQQVGTGLEDDWLYVFPSGVCYALQHVVDLP